MGPTLAHQFKFDSGGPRVTAGDKKFTPSFFAAESTVMSGFARFLRHKKARDPGPLRDDRKIGMSAPALRRHPCRRGRSNPGRDRGMTKAY